VVLPVSSAELIKPLGTALLDDDDEDEGTGGGATFDVESTLILPLLLRLSMTGDGIIADHQGTRKSY
jgi:hypothetical protein